MARVPAPEPPRVGSEKPLEKADRGRRWSAEMIFQAGPRLTVGYRGYWRCTPAPPG